MAAVLRASGPSIQTNPVTLVASFSGASISVTPSASGAALFTLADGTETRDAVAAASSIASLSAHAALASAPSLSNAAATDAVAAHASQLSALLRMGVQHTHFQAQKRAQLLTDDVRAALSAVDAALSAAPFLHAADAPGPTDALVFGRVAPFVTALLTSDDARAMPRLFAWFDAVAHTEQAARVIGADPMFTARAPREGGQIDQRPDPRVVAAACEDAMTLNRDAKKHGGSQRDKERANKDSTAAADSSSSSSSSSSAAAAAPAPAPAASASASASAAAAAATPALPAIGSVAADGSNKASVIAALQERLATLSIAQATFEHEAVANVEEHSRVLAGKDGLQVKNLFLKGKKAREEGDSCLWLVCAAASRRLDMKELGNRLKYKQGVRFAPEETLGELLGVRQGSVTVFAVANDTTHQVRVALDKSVAEAELVHFHPLSNEATTSVSGASVIKFLEAHSCRYEVIDFDSA